MLKVSLEIFQLLNRAIITMVANPDVSLWSERATVQPGQHTMRRWSGTNNGMSTNLLIISLASDTMRAAAVDWHQVRCIDIVN